MDSKSLNDASVTAGESATTAFISRQVNRGHTPRRGGDGGPIVISRFNSVIDSGMGDHAIQFLAGAGADALVLHSGGLDQVSGFDPDTDVLDLRSLLSEANVNLNGGVAALSGYLTVDDQGSDTLIRFDSTGHGGGSTIAVLQGLGTATVTGLTFDCVRSR